MYGARRTDWCVMVGITVFQPRTVLSNFIWVSKFSQSQQVVQILFFPKINHQWSMVKDLPSAPWCKTMWSIRYTLIYSKTNQGGYTNNSTTYYYYNSTQISSSFTGYAYGYPLRTSAWSRQQRATWVTSPAGIKCFADRLKPVSTCQPNHNFVFITSARQNQNKQIVKVQHFTLLLLN